MEGRSEGANKRKAEGDIESDRRNEDKMPKADRTPPPRGRRGSTGGDNPVSESTLRLLMEGLENRLLGSIGGEVKKNKDDIKELRESLVATESNLLERMDEQQRNFEAMLQGQGRAAAAGAQPEAGRRLSAKQEEAYWLHRRSLSIWPVQGDDVIPAVKTFLMTKLRFTEEQIRDLGKISIKRMREPVPRARKEAFCTFETKEARDVVKASSKHLAGEGNDVGLRAQFPTFMLEAFRSLETVGYHLRAADPSVRRSIKVDDTTMSLMMDVKVGDSWRRIRPEEARNSLRDNPQILNGPKEMTSADITTLLSKATTPASGANATRMG